MLNASLIDVYQPVWDFGELHRIEVRAGPLAVDRAVGALDLRSSRAVRLLFAMRGMPDAALTLKGMESLGFEQLAHRPGEERVIGVIGRFWTIGGGIECVAPEAFTDFNEPGFAKATWNFHITPLGETATRLSTETRIRCTDEASRQKFRRYWALIRPFSGWIRREALRAIKVAAERQ